MKGGKFIFTHLVEGGFRGAYRCRLHVSWKKSGGDFTVPKCPKYGPKVIYVTPEVLSTYNIADFDLDGCGTKFAQIDDFKEKIEGNVEKTKTLTETVLFAYMKELWGKVMGSITKQGGGDEKYDDFKFGTPSLVKNMADFVTDSVDVPTMREMAQFHLISRNFVFENFVPFGMG